METSLKKMESEAEHVEKKAANLGKSAVQDKMKVVGTIGSILSVCMYVSYIPQIIGNLSGHPGDWIQPFVAFINCTIWVTYGFFKQQRDRHRQLPGNRLRPDHCIDCALLAEGRILSICEGEVRK